MLTFEYLHLTGVVDIEQRSVLKLWFSKQQVRKKYLAVCEEKRPLQQSRQDGRQSNLGMCCFTSCLMRGFLRTNPLHTQERVEKLPS